MEKSDFGGRQTIKNDLNHDEYDEMLFLAADHVNTLSMHKRISSTQQPITKAA